MWFKAKAVLKFLWHSKNQHGIHSPFIYKLITKCFYNKEHFEAYDLWDRAKKEVFDSIKVSKNIKHASISKKRARLMIRLVDYLSVKHALELGTSLGLGSISIAGSGQVNLKTIETLTPTSDFAQHQFDKLKLTQITSINSSFAESLAGLKSEEKFDLVFIHGHHEGEAALPYFESLLEHKHNDTLFILDDIHRSPSMEMAWEKIKTHKETQVTIDTFQWGLVFFRKEQVKQNFVIRI